MSGAKSKRHFHGALLPVRDSKTALRCTPFKAGEGYWCDDLWSLNQAPSPASPWSVCLQTRQPLATWLHSLSGKESNRLVSSSSIPSALLRAASLCTARSFSFAISSTFTSRPTCTKKTSLFLATSARVLSLLHACSESPPFCRQLILCSCLQGCWISYA